MADPNESKEEAERPENGTARINLPSPPHRPPEAKVSVTNLRPASAPIRPPQPSVAPQPLPSREGFPGLRPPVPPLICQSSSAGLKTPPSPSPVAPSIAAFQPSKPGFPPINRPLENHGIVQAGAPKETSRVADSLSQAAAKLSKVPPAKVPLPPLTRNAPPVVAKSPVKGLVASAPAHLWWALLGISLLTLLMQLWNYFS